MLRERHVGPGPELVSHTLGGTAGRAEGRDQHLWLGLLNPRAGPRFRAEFPPSSPLVSGHRTARGQGCLRVAQSHTLGAEGRGGQWMVPGCPVRTQ